MTLGGLILRSLWRFRRSNLGVCLGVAVSTTVIAGALLVGDTMRGTLQQAADQRLGGVSHVLSAGDRFYTTDLARSLGPDASAAVVFTGVLSTPDGSARANDVQVCGIDMRFSPLLGGPDPPAPGEAILNDQLAAQLGVRAGDALVLRVPEPTGLPIDAALVNASKPARALRLTVAGVANASSGGRFSLRAEQRPPLNLFVDRAWLAEQMGVPGRVNATLMPAPPNPFEVSLDDLELTLDRMADGRSMLTTSRVFIDASIEDDLRALPGQRVLTYMVNTIALSDKQSPYAMVAAVDQLAGLNLKPDEIAINQWLADDLNASVGDTLTLTYFLPDEGDRLIEAEATLTVSQVVPLDGPYTDRTLTPNFPGLADAERLSRWDAGPAIDRTRIRERDEQYWDDYRATPKAFITLAKGQSLWANRFGTVTAIRFDPAIDEPQLIETIDPVPLGFSPLDVRRQAADAAKGTVDFAQLFLSLSMFIIVAGVALTATLFAMSVEQRARQLGTLAALGFTPGQLRIMILGEGAIVAVLGAGAGLLGGWGYTKAVVAGLNGTWSGAVAGTPLTFHANTLSLITGPMSAVLMCLLAIAFALRSLINRPARELLNASIGHASGPPRLPGKVWWIASICCLACAFYFVFAASQQAGMRAGLSGFAAGGSLMACMVAGLTALLIGIRQTQRQSTSDHAPALSILRFSLRSLTRRRGRTLTAIITLGCGVFLVLAVSGFRLTAGNGEPTRRAGTGGFALIVESSQPIRYDLNTVLGRDHYALSERELPPGSLVPLRMNSGDDASCLNLNQTPSPRMLGVDPALLTSRGAFTFQKAIDRPAQWSLIGSTGRSAAPIPAIADANTAQWALKLSVGDTLELTDEKGRAFTIELVATIENTILQGCLIIDERVFEMLYPSTSGYRMLLVDAQDPDESDARAELLSEVLVDEGVQITPASQRLADYNQVQNTYLSIFQALGGLGVVLGALGLGVIAARNLIERRAELALLSAIGWSRRRITSAALLEHVALLLAGLFVGGAAALLATLHASGGIAGLYETASLTLTATLLTGLLSVYLGLRSARSGRLIDALRND